MGHARERAREREAGPSKLLGCGRTRQADDQKNEKAKDQRGAEQDFKEQKQTRAKRIILRLNTSNSNSNSNKFKLRFECNQTKHYAPV